MGNLNVAVDRAVPSPRERRILADVSELTALALDCRRTSVLFPEGGKWTDDGLVQCAIEDGSAADKPHASPVKNVASRLQQSGTLLVDPRRTIFRVRLPLGTARA